MKVNRFGEIVQRTWMDLPRHYPYISLDWFVIMPNHVHAIIFQNTVETGRGGSPVEGNATMINPIQAGVLKVSAGETRPYTTKRHGLQEIVRAFKSFSARRINQIRDTHGTAVWQRNYYDHIIRNEQELQRIHQYILDNPLQWLSDEENTAKIV